MKNIPKKYHSAIRKLIKKAREEERTRAWNLIDDFMDNILQNNTYDVIRNFEGNFSSLLKQIKEL